MIKAVGFDLGHTLVSYANLRWNSLYATALGNAMEGIGAELTDEMTASAIAVLTKYNTRVNYREYEVTSDVIFGEIMENWQRTDIDSKALRAGFYAFFQASAAIYPDAESTLKALKRAGMGIGILTDVAYGMDDEFSLKDIAQLCGLYDIALTSVAVGYRKPNRAGFDALARYFNLRPEEMLFVGDEEKDIVGANNAGMLSVLINRTPEPMNFNQAYTIDTLSGILKLID